MTRAGRLTTAGLAAAALAAGLACAGGDAESRTQAVLSISGAMVVEPVLDDDAALYLTIRNGRAGEDTLVAIRSAVADRAEVHEQVQDGDMVRMRPRETLVVPPGGEVTFRPGGLHIMLMGLTGSLAAGDTVAIEFRFARGGTLTERVPVVSYAELP